MKTYRYSPSLLLVLILCILSTSLTAEDQSFDEGVPKTLSITGEPQPFGHSLFSGKSAAQRANALDPSYIITPGDKVSLHIWGAIQADEITSVDSQGNLFIPEIGAVKVGGRTASELPGLIKGKLQSVYKDGVDAYVNLLTTTPVSVFVTGPVLRPGQYAGVQSDSVLSYLQQAGGILPNQGSYRSIRVLRHSRPIANIDLYSFLRFGQLPKIRFEDGDTILVSPQSSMITVQGDARGGYRFELKQASTSGRELITIARPNTSVTNIALSGSRNRQPWSAYLSLSEFGRTKLLDGDVVRFITDSPRPTMDISIEGSHLGNSFYAVKRGARLQELLDYVAVAPDEADINNIYIKRKSVAEQQKKNLSESIDRLERSILTAPARSDAEASIRKDESALISEFIKRSRQTETEGRVVVSENGQIANIRLEDGDIIVIPYKSDVITVSGEVQMPQSIVYGQNASIDDYIARAGGFSVRADRNNIVIRKANGQVVTRGLLEAGDELIVFPRVDAKDFQFAKDILGIIFQVAATSKAVGIL